MCPSRSITVATFAPLTVLLFHPKRFFSKEIDPAASSALLTWFLVSLLPLGLSLLLMGTGLSWIPLQLPADAIMAIAIGYGTQLLGLALLTALAHIFASLFSGRAGPSGTFRAIAYGQVPVLLLYWLVFLHPLATLALLAAGLWSLYLTYTGLSILHRIGEWPAFACYLIPAIILYAVRTLLGL